MELTNVVSRNDGSTHNSLCEIVILSITSLRLNSEIPLTKRKDLSIMKHSLRSNICSIVIEK